MGNKEICRAFALEENICPLPPCSTGATLSSKALSYRHILGNTTRNKWQLVALLIRREEMRQIHGELPPNPHLKIQNKQGKKNQLLVTISYQHSNKVIFIQIIHGVKDLTL